MLLEGLKNDPVSTVCSLEMISSGSHCYWQLPSHIRRLIWSTEHMPNTRPLPGDMYSYFKDSTEVAEAFRVNIINGHSLIHFGANLVLRAPAHIGTPLSPVRSACVVTHGKHSFTCQWFKRSCPIDSLSGYGFSIDYSRLSE